jgi:hypothetical protein
MSEFPPQPADTQDSIVVEVLREYIRPGLVDSTIRTWVPILIGSVLAWVAAHWNIVVPAHASSTVVVATTGLVTAGYYIAARLVEKRYPRLGHILLALGLTRAKPVYAQPATVKAVRGDDVAPVPTDPAHL